MVEIKSLDEILKIIKDRRHHLMINKQEGTLWINGKRLKGEDTFIVEDQLLRELEQQIEHKYNSTCKRW